MTEKKAILGFIGGTGIYAVVGLENISELDIDTPFGKPSSKIVIGEIQSVKVAFIARHDTTHRLLPSEIPFRANIYAMKLLGVQYLVSFGACGSLKEELKPSDIVLVDQFIDRTSNRASTFFGEGIISHVSFGDPVCSIFKSLIYESIKQTFASDELSVHDGGTYVCIDGPCFSSRAESKMYQLWGGSIVGMTAIPEAKLAREAEISYVCVALVTDFDCWHPDHDNVTVEMVMKNLAKNGFNAQKIVQQVATIISNNKFTSKAHSSLQYAILTPHHHIPPQTVGKLSAILTKYMPPSEDKAH